MSLFNQTNRWLINHELCLLLLFFDDQCSELLFDCPVFLFVFILSFSPNPKRNASSAEIFKMTLLFKIIGFSTLFLLINNFCMGKIESRLRVGKTINVFVRYGYLGISMKVISYNDTERWLFKEPTYNVFRVSCLHSILRTNKKKIISN